MDDTQHKYVIYDGRARHNPDDAQVFSVCDTLQEANNERDEWSSDTVVIRYDVVGPNQLDNPLVMQ